MTRAALRARQPALALLLLLALALLSTRFARAHDPFEITTDAHVSGEGLLVHTTWSLLTATRACFDGADAERRLTPADFESQRARFEACARDVYRITSGGRSGEGSGATVLALRSAAVSLSVEADVEMKLVYARPTQTPLIFDAIRLQRLAPRAGVVLTVTGTRTFLGQKLLRPDDSRFEIPITEEAEAPGTPPLPSLGSYLLLGIQHIAGGFDHLLFLFGLLVVCRRIRSVVVIVSCFTLAHSLTLALAALQWLTLPSHIVEPLIAATIVFVGVENLMRPVEPEGPWLSRWLVAFGFGLVHGLGFASALSDIGLGAFGTSVLGPLIAFNLGVEIGQLSVAAVFLALLWGVVHRAGIHRLGSDSTGSDTPGSDRALGRRFPQIASLMVAAIGLFWFVQRILS